jgi:hypothetical protein
LVYKNASSVDSSGPYLMNCVVMKMQFRFLTHGFILLTLLSGMACASSRNIGSASDRQSKAFVFATRSLQTALEESGATDVGIIIDGADSPIRKSASCPNGEAYRISPVRQTATRKVHIQATELAGRVYGTLRLAREVRLGAVPDAFHIDATPAYSQRMVDVEAPFYPPEDRPERPYWLGGYRDMYNIDEAPYIDLKRMGKIEDRFERFCQISLENGYNALLFVVVQNRMLDPEIWPSVKLDKPHRERLRHWRALYKKLLKTADAYGLSSYLWTSELTLPGPVLTALQEEGAVSNLRSRNGADVTHPGVYRELEKKYRYLVETYPEVDGYLIRVGELGGGEKGVPVYNRSFPNTKEWSRETRVAHFFGEMEELISGKLGRTMIARTWWVGHPSIHTDPVKMGEAVSRIKSASSWLAIKNTHEFWGHLPLNPTLAAATHTVIVEYQGCREYDGMGSHPVVLAEQYSRRFKETKLAKTGGIWTWVKLGGSGGQYRLPYFHGLEDWTEANVYFAGRLAWNPQLDANTLRREFARLKVGKDAAADYAELLRLAESARNKGLYVKPACEENPWHPMFPTYRNYFYAGEIIAREDKVKTKDPVEYIFKHYRDRWDEINSDMKQALADRKKSAQLAKSIATHSTPEYGKALQQNVRHGLALQAALTQWIATADVYYRWREADSPNDQKQNMQEALRELKAKRKAYDTNYGEYIDRGYGMRGFIKCMEEELAR